MKWQLQPNIWKMARQAEEDLEWSKAAEYYKFAIDVYPCPIGPLAAADIRRLTEYMENCKYMARVN